MNPNLKNILKHLKPAPQEEELLRYLKKELSQDEQHGVEEYLVDDDFYDDAVEGLEMVSKDTNLSGLVGDLNKNLDKQLKKKSKRKNKDVLAHIWPIISVIVILLLAITAYFIIKRLG